MIKKIYDLLWKNKSIGQIIFKNTFWLLAGQIISRAIKLILVIYTARLVGASTYGSFSYALSLAGLAFMFSELGVITLMIREYNKPGIEKVKLVSNSIALKLALLVGSTLIAATVSYFIHNAAIQQTLWLISGMYLVGGIRDILLGIAKAEKRMEIDSLSVISEATATTLLGLLFLFTYHSIVMLAWGYLGGMVFSLLFTVLIGYRYIPKNLTTKTDPELIKSIFTTAWPFSLGVIIYFALSSTDTLMLSWLTNPATVGQYSVGSRIIQILLILPSQLGLALIPMLSSLTNIKEQFVTIVKKSLSYVMILAIPICLGGLVVADKIILGFFGPDYSMGVLSFRILLLAIPVIFPVLLLDYALLTINLQNKDFQYTAVAAVVNILLNLLLIPKYGLYGAATATLIAQIINLVLTLRLSIRNWGTTIISSRSLLNSLSASLIMVLFLWLAKFTPISVWLALPIAVLIYFSSLYLLREETIINGLSLVAKKYD